MISKRAGDKYKRRKNLILLLFIVSLAAALGFCVYTGVEMRQFSEYTYEETEQRLLSVSRYAAVLVTAEELAELQTPEDMPGPVFGELRRRMDVFAKENNILYVYYMRNTEDGLAQYILDNDFTEEAVDLTTDPIEWENSARIALDGQGAAAEMHKYLSGYEHLISAFAPVYDAGGQVVAVAGVDISDEQMLGMHRTMNLLIPLQALGVLAIGVCGFLSVFMYNRADRDRVKLTLEVEKGDIDTLTGVYNRRFFDRHMDRLVESLSQTGRQLGLLMVDIDFFKQYNDTYGHLAGDECLQLVAKSLRNGIWREEDFIARYGGEEFFAVLPDADEAGAREIAERLLKGVQDLDIPHCASAVSDHVTVSIGVASVKVEKGADWKEYVKRADEFLYMAKQSGRDCCAHFGTAGAEQPRAPEILDA